MPSVLCPVVGFIVYSHLNIYACCPCRYTCEKSEDDSEGQGADTKRLTRGAGGRTREAGGSDQPPSSFSQPPSTTLIRRSAAVRRTSLLGPSTTLGNTRIWNKPNCTVALVIQPLVIPASAVIQPAPFYQPQVYQAQLDADAGEAASLREAAPPCSSFSREVMVREAAG